MTNNGTGLTLETLERALKEKADLYERALSEGKPHEVLLQIYKEMKALQFEITATRNSISALA